ncbi:hypothetical protein IY145_03990 [Methylosinus sp. H3A]|uniref:hypothetical protein n=1 Tax=Methylosinus sp. H3A TaxID=2785786 RepID=UPI0018C2307E|nr:hypothetical protein [Methylosinus sp. H3A]MBG0808530.1 hypothetical protein [Methylosinus sp. H3A]
MRHGAVAPSLDVEAAATVMIGMIDGMKALSLRDTEFDRRAAEDLIQRIFSCAEREEEPTTSGKSPKIAPRPQFAAGRYEELDVQFG